MKHVFLVLALMFLGLSVSYVGAEEVKAEHQEKFCPVCGPHAHGETAKEELSLSYKHEGKKYYFCSMDCLKAFKNNPEKFLKSDAAHEGHA